MKPAPLEVELLTDSDSRRPMGKQRLEDERLRTATDSARPLPAGIVEELLADLRRLEAEKLKTHNSP